MKKLMMFAFAAAMISPVFAQETAETKPADKEAQPQKAERRVNDVWPAFLAVCEFPANPDVVGLRLTLPFSTTQDNVTGIDLGLWGRSNYFEGIQVNIIRNDVKDDISGIQVGLYNTASGADFFAAQVGLWNEADSLRGFQVGLLNIAGEARGLQVGLINRCDTMYGYQVGLINVIRDAELQFCPILNIGF